MVRVDSARRPEVAFVLSGGAALGAAQVGMLRALLERGIMPDLIVGTSIGSWNGLWLAAHPTLAGLDGLERIWKRASIPAIFGSNALELVANITARRPYLVTNEGMKRFYQRAAVDGNMIDITFEQLSIPFMVAATNITHGTSEIIASGLVEPAVLASSAIPGLLPPMTIAGQQYVDGGLLDNGGVGIAARAGAKRIYVLSVMSVGSLSAPIMSLSDLIVRSLHLVTASHVRTALAQYADKAEFIVIEDETLEKRSALDFHHTSELFASGYYAAKRILDEHERQKVALATRAWQEQRESTPVAQLLRHPVTLETLRTLAWVDISAQKLGERLTTLFG